MLSSFLSSFFFLHSCSQCLGDLLMVIITFHFLFQNCQRMEIWGTMSSKLWRPPCTSPLSMKKVLRILLGTHERICWWLLWRILRVSSFKIIFGLLTELIWILKSGKGKEKWFKACKDASLFFSKLKNSYQDSICVQGDFNQRNLEFKDAINLFLFKANNFFLEHNFYSWKKGGEGEKHIIVDQNGQLKVHFCNPILMYFHIKTFKSHWN
jgi:hypothetical protein